ncbi:MAG TPA: sulfurtransferase-like selenium metabolism protein YedF [Bacteroidales bacterium]|nr:sulfurtransferase-like selenium metabolism protein YedF [Bacteroidales bacterium]
MKTIDTRGKTCPLPLMMAKKALSEMEENETLLILIDNEISMTNVTRFLKEHGMSVSTEKQGEVYRLLVSKTGNIPESTNMEAYCETAPAGNSGYIIAFQRDCLGDGVEELGRILIQAFINTLPETDLKPDKLIFINSGIFLALKSSPVTETLKKLEAAGTDILVCGTCLDYYGKKDELGAGHISNMYDILSSMTKASKIIYP